MQAELKANTVDLDLRTPRVRSEKRSVLSFERVKGQLHFSLPTQPGVIIARFKHDRSTHVSALTLECTLPTYRCR